LGTDLSNRLREKYSAAVLGFAEARKRDNLTSVPDHLLQDLMNPRGYVARPGKPKATEAAVALTADGQVIYGDPKTARSTYAKAGSKLIYYDDEVERQRRLTCDTALGQLMLDHPKFAQPAVDLVSRGIELYWQTLSSRLSGTDAFQKIAEVDGKYVSNATSFGRLPVAKPSQSEVNQFKAKIDIWLTSLRSGDLPRIMNLHDTFLKIYCSNEKGVGKPMEVATRFGFREDWYEGAARGRENRPNTSYTQSTMPGLITSDFTIPFVAPLERSGIDLGKMRVESRNRGTEMFMISARAMRPEFRQVLGENNLVFAASASGTTSTLLSSAKIFQPSLLNTPDSTKQYLMGCVAYLIGGGMHTCHEVFYTGGIAGLTYTPGKYIDMLPRTFTSSRLYERWATEFWDIVRPDRPSPR
jgi:hypothetical protein